MPLQVVLNGKEREFADLPPACPVPDLIQELGFRADRVALERNGQIVPRTTWPSVTLHTGDRLELVHFVGGGSSDPA